ncbi:MAG: ATP-binding protein [Candidatus Nanohaloarchaea archaeon]
MEAAIVQRDDTPNSREFFFVYDPGTGQVGKGSYIQYEKKGTVVARVAEVYKANEYFENAESVAESLSGGEETRLPVDEWQVSIGKAEIVGKFEDGMQKRVKDSPEPGKPLEVAEKQVVKQLLGLKDDGITIGQVQQQGIPATLGVTDTLQKHFAVLAQSGAGKSYTVSVMLEELLENDHAPGMLAVDPHGDYTSFAEDENYMGDVKVFTEKNVQIAVKDLSAEQIAGFFNGMSGAQRQELNEVINALNKGETSDYDLDDVVSRVERKEMNDKTRYALIRKLRKLQGMNIFGKSNTPSAGDIKPGKLNVIDLSESIDHEKKQIIAAFFSRHFFKKRRKGRIPPVLMLFEEAHNFARDSEPSPSRTIIEKIAREGRKFHASLGLVSQRPVKLSTTALSQCNTQFILRVTNPNDLEHIAKSSEGITSEVSQQIPGLKTGEAIAIGEAVNHPTFIDVRERRSKEPSTGEGLEAALDKWREEEEQLDEDAESFM